MKLNVKAFALTCGILWGIAILFATYFFVITGRPGVILSKISYIYLGYSVSWLGGLIGLVWGFIDGLISGAIFAWLYNKLCGKNQ